MENNPRLPDTTIEIVSSYAEDYEEGQMQMAHAATSLARDRIKSSCPERPDCQAIADKGRYYNVEDHTSVHEYYVSCDKEGCPQIEPSKNET
jgi:hypothetical protein